MHRHHHHTHVLHCPPHRGYGGPPRGRGFGPRARRGDVRGAVLRLLAEQPRNGYGLMQELEDRTSGLWRPSPGAMYPALNLLEDEGLITTTEVDGKKAYALTDAGKAEADGLTGPAPWEQLGREAPEGAGELRKALGALAMAAEQVARTGDDDAVARASAIVTDARKALYGLLAS